MKNTLEKDGIKDKTLIFIDNESKWIIDAQTVLSNAKWKDYFHEKKFFLLDTSEVHKLILEYGARDCIIICDKNMEDRDGAEFLIELNDKYDNLYYSTLYTAHPNQRIGSDLKDRGIDYELKADFSLLMTNIESKLTKPPNIPNLLDIYSSEGYQMTSRKKIKPDSLKHEEENTKERTKNDLTSEPVASSEDSEKVTSIVNSYKRFADLYISEMKKLKAKKPNFSIQFFNGQPPMNVGDFITEVENLTPLGRKYLDNWIEGIKEYENV